MTERKWIQLNKDNQCPNCGKFALEGITVVNELFNPKKNTYEYQCSECKARFKELK